MAESYDVFITYRGGADFVHANALYDVVKRCDLKPAMDCFDFSPAETFLDEMARCVAASRYTVALITSRYATSQFPQEEAIMQKVLDNNDRKRRLIATYVEDYPAPLWMQSLVGVRLFRDKGDKNHFELKRLLKLLLHKDDQESASHPEIDTVVENTWSKLPAEILRYGLYGAAGYGALSLIADLDLDLDTIKDGVQDSISDVVAGSSDQVHEHIVDNLQGAVRGVGRVVKGLLDDLF